MYIIDEPSYFIKKLIVPSTTEIDVSETANPFDMWIDQEARLCLQNALGHVLFDDFDSNVTNGIYVPGVTKWDNLVNGTTYTYNGISYKWKGLIFTEGLAKQSLLAYFVYAKWLDDRLTSMSGMGESRGKAINSDTIYSRRNYKTQYNNFVTLYQADVTKTNGCYHLNSSSSYVSLIEFLIHNEADYPDAELELYFYENQLGI